MPPRRTGCPRRVAYFVGRPFRNAHDSYAACVPKTMDYVRPPTVGGHEAISVGVSCGDSVRLSSVMAGISWISAHGEVDATVIIPHEYVGMAAAERAIQELRGKGLTLMKVHATRPGDRARNESDTRDASRPHVPALLSGAALAIVLATALRHLRKRSAPPEPLLRGRCSRHSQDDVDVRTLTHPQRPSLSI